MRRVLVAILAVLALAGCASPAPPEEPPAPGATPSAAPPSPTAGPTAASPAPTAPRGEPPPPAAPTTLPDDDRTFELRLPARDGRDHEFLVNASERTLLTLLVRNAEPAPRGFGATTVASGPDGTGQQDSGVVPDGGAAFALRLAPFEQTAADGPALLRVRVSATVPVVVEGRVDVDEDVPDEGGSTVP